MATIEPSHTVFGVPAIPDTSLITGDVMRFREVSGPQAKPGTIEVHIIRPGRGSSGYYTENVLRSACESGVYPKGMLMHWDHPTRQQEEDQPARVVGTIAAALAENATYREAGDPNAWDGPGPYALAEVHPKYVEDVKWLAGKIGVSHYVDGVSEEADCPDGKRGRMVKELLPSPFNSVDFVTIPGAGGHSRFNEVRLRENSERKPMATKQVSIRLSELMTSDPEVVTELRAQLTEELKLESQKEAQKNRITEAQKTIRSLEVENKKLREKIAERAAREYAAAEIAKAKLPESVGKNLLESIVAGAKMTEIIKQEGEKWVLYAADGEEVLGEFDTEEEALERERQIKAAAAASSESARKTGIDTVTFGEAVSKAIKAKQEEIAAIQKELGVPGITENGGTPFPSTDAQTKKAREEYRDTLIGMGKTTEQANRLAGIEVR